MNAIHKAIQTASAIYYISTAEDTNKKKALLGSSAIKILCCQELMLSIHLTAGYCFHHKFDEPAILLRELEFNSKLDRINTPKYPFNLFKQKCKKKAYTQIQYINMSPHS